MLAYLTENIRLIIGGLLLSFALSGWVWGFACHLRATRATTALLTAQAHAAKAAKAAADQDVKRLQAVYSARLIQERKRTEEANARNKTLQTALRDNVDWTAAPVPDGVWDALLGPGGTPAP